MLQFAYNEASLRFRPPPLPFTTTLDLENGDALEKPFASGSNSDLPKKETSEKVMDVMTWVAPVKKLTDQEYAEIMRKQQEAVEKRLREMEKEKGRSSGERAE